MASQIGVILITVASPVQKTIAPKLISVKLNEEFILNGIIQQEAIIDYESDFYKDLKIQIVAINKIGDTPTTDLKISVTKRGTLVSFKTYNIREKHEINFYGVKLKLLNFLKEGDKYTSAKFIIEKPKTWSVFIEFIRKMLFG